MQPSTRPEQEPERGEAEADHRTDTARTTCSLSARPLCSRAAARHEPSRSAITLGATAWMSSGTTISRPGEERPCLPATLQREARARGVERLLPSPSSWRLLSRISQEHVVPHRVGNVDCAARLACQSHELVDLDHRLAGRESSRGGPGRSAFPFPRGGGKSRLDAPLRKRSSCDSGSG